MARNNEWVLPLILALLLLALFVGGRLVITSHLRPLRAMRQSAIESLRRPQGMPSVPAKPDGY